MVETIQYEPIRELGNVEIRKYPAIIVAKVVDPEADGFSLLYKFITGKNTQKVKVQMTSPVLTETGSMAFVMPKELTFETTPQPLDERVKIASIPSRTLAVLCFSGGWSEKHFEKETNELLNELAKAGIKTKGNVFTMLYNPPYIPGFLRRNEAAIEIEEATK